MNNSEFYEELKNGVLAGHINQTAAANKDFHFHNSYEMFLFLNGKAEAYVEQSKYTLVPGTLLLFNNHEIHKASNLSKEPYERITIHFPPSMLQMLINSDTNLLTCFHQRSNGTHNAFLLTSQQQEEFTTIAHKLIVLLADDTYAKDVLILSYLIQLLVIANKSFNTMKEDISKPISFIVGKLMSYVDNNLSSSPTLDDIAKHLSMDKFYISHQFKKQTGDSLYHYILMKKIALSKQLLSQGATVMESCEQSGFHDYNNFIRTFKKYTGLSPGQYKKSNSW